MLRGFRHKLLLLLQTGILVSAGLALLVQPAAWPAILVATAGSSLAAYACGRVARRYLHASIGRLRRMADNIGRGGPPHTLEVHPGDDMYKLTAAVNVLATRLSAAAREEERLHDELRRRERLAFLGEFAASVAHEINNPLDGVQNCARILRRSLEDPPRATQMLDLIDGGLARIELIVRRLLTLAREQGVRPAPVQLRDVVAGALALLGPRLESQGIVVEQKRETEDDQACVDAPLLEQVLVNLLVNAADSMPHGGCLGLTIRREVAGPGGLEQTGTPLLCVEVADTGAGIPPDVLPHIFEPFFTTKTGGKGTGLGLAIAQRIVDAHHGTLSVAPRIGGGTVFTVRLPANVEAVANP